ncbi:MAG: DNA polymerase IV, partial [Rhodococcus sp.]|nr:DNA polymerase IV [Rhodococcus sp. (in: high G+C Gram-positive bacteria)]
HARAFAVTGCVKNTQFTRARALNQSPTRSRSVTPDPHQVGRAGKPAGVYRLTQDNWMAVMADHPTDDLWGIGRKTAQKLAEHGIHTVAELAEADPKRLAAIFGPTIGPGLCMVGRGLGGTEVTTTPREARSRSRARTFPEDLTDRAQIEEKVAELARDIGGEVIATGRAIMRVGVTVRTAAFFTRTKAAKLAAPTTDVAEIEAAALMVLERFELDRPVRLLGVRVALVPDTT